MVRAAQRATAAATGRGALVNQLPGPHPEERFYLALEKLRMLERVERVDSPILEARILAVSRRHYLGTLLTREKYVPIAQMALETAAPRREVVRLEHLVRVRARVRVRVRARARARARARVRA